MCANGHSPLWGKSQPCNEAYYNFFLIDEKVSLFLIFFIMEVEHLFICPRAFWISLLWIVFPETFEDGFLLALKSWDLAFTELSISWTPGGKLLVKGDPQKHRVQVLESATYTFFSQMKHLTLFNAKQEDKHVNIILMCLHSSRSPDSL